MANGPAARQLIDASGNPFGTNSNPIFTNLVDGTVFNVQYAPYNADPFGVQDSTTAIQNAINAAAAAGGGVVLIPPGTYKTSGSLVINGDKVIIRGYGLNSIIQPATNSNFDAISTPIPASSGLPGFTRNFILIEQLMLDCSKMTGTTAGQGNGIHTYGTRYSGIRDVLITGCPNWPLLLDGDSTNFGFDINLERNITDVSAGGCFQQNCEANHFLNNRFKYGLAACAAAQPAFGSQDTNTNHLRLGSGYATVMANVFGKGGTYNGAAILCSNSGPTKIIGNRFDQVRHQAVILNAGNHEFIGNALGSPCSANTGDPAIQIGNSHMRIIGNSFDNTAGSTHHTFCVQESGGPFTDNIISDNYFIQGVSGNGFVSLNAASTDMVHHNRPYNPVGSVTPPAFPATTVAVTNNTGLDVSVFVVNGTGAITVVQINGTTTGLTIAASATQMIRLPACASISFTYGSGTPTWTWFGD